MATFKPTINNKMVPVCPNHGEPLEGLPSPVPAKGNGRCPISKVMFAYSINAQSGDTEYAKDHDGNLTALPTFTVHGDEDGATQ